MNIVVIIPTYNEAENIGRMLDALMIKELPKIKEHKMRVLVVDSNSPDGTASIVKKAKRKYKNVFLLETKRQGLGADYVKGMRYAIEKMKADVVIEFDADFQHDPRDIKRMVAAMDRGADHVIGSRYVKGGSIPPEWGVHRKAMSYLGSLFARVVFFTPRIHDMTSGMKLTKVSYLKRVDLDNLLSKYYAYKLHILHDVVRMGARVIEVPIVFRERMRGSSKIDRRDLVDSFLVVIKLRMRDSSRFIKFGVVGFFGFAINALALEGFFRIGMGTAVAAALGAELAIVSNFTFNNVWTFKGEKGKRGKGVLGKFLKFNLTSAGAIVIQAVVVGIGTGLFGDSTRQLMLVIAVAFFVVPYNYITYNVFIWKTWKVPGRVPLLFRK